MKPDESLLSPWQSPSWGGGRAGSGAAGGTG